MSHPRPRDFVEARPGPGWDILPLPALILDGCGRVAAMNEAAEFWLNLSRNSTLGKALEGDEIATRLRIDPALGPMIARVKATDETGYHPLVTFEIGDRAGGHLTRRAAVHLGRGAEAGGAVSLLIVPQEVDGIHQSRSVRSAARSAIGMAEMLAHEIKNPLAGIRGAAQLMAMNAPPEDREMAEMIVSESRRIVALLDQVERFGDTTAPDLRAVNLHDILERARRSAELGFARNVEVITEYDPSLPDALGDDDQLMQVALNLLKNATEALTRGPGGRTIRIRSFYDGALRVARSETAPQGRMLPLQIEIEDDGPGIPEGIASQIFEPFVSGRENGTGLGLALVSKIVTDHGGWLRVDSRPGRTVFRISLPKA